MGPGLVAYPLAHDAGSVNEPDAPPDRLLRGHAVNVAVRVAQRESERESQRVAVCESFDESIALAQ